MTFSSSLNFAPWRVFQTLGFVLGLALAFPGGVLAKGKKGGGAGEGAKAFAKIVSVDAVSIAVSRGTDGNTHQSYVINNSTKVTLNGAPANARDLRAGMVAEIEVAADGKTAISIVAKDASAHPEKHRVG